MTRRTASWIAWPACGLVVAASAGSLVLRFAGGAHSPSIQTFSLLLSLAFPVIGAVIATRRPKNPIGWIFVAVGVSFAAATLSSEYASYALITRKGAVPFGGFAAWVSTWAWPPGIVLTFTFLLLLFPTGALPSRRWRPVAWLAWAAIALTVIPVAIAGWPIRGPVLVNIGESAPAASSAAFKTAYGVQVAGILLLFALGLASAASLVLRLRRAHGDERAQLAWFALGGTLLVVGLILSSPLFHLGTDIVPALVLPLLPLAAAVAILKYRLYDIDVVINKTVVFGTLTVAITAIYAAIVAGIGTLAGRQGSLLLAALAAAVVAVAFQPLRQRAQHLANRVVYGRRATPYEVLSEFSGRVAGAYATEDVLPQMAKILAGGTGATSAAVWLATGPELRLSAAWPEQTPGPGAVRLAGDSLPAIPGAGGVAPVRHQGQLLGALAVTMPPTEPLTPATEKLIRDLAAQAGLVVRNVRLVEDLLASRQRLVTAQDQERRKLERNLHDGAQQQLVALALKQRLAEDLVRQDPDQAIAMLADLQQETREALANLRELARGIYPPLLADLGLLAALESRVRKSPVPVAIDADGAGRYAQEVEAAVYFCCLEALQNVAKYAAASTVHIHLADEMGWLIFSVADDGHGYDSTTTAMGSGIQNMADRLSALGGSLDVRSVPGGGTTVTGRIPIPAAQPAPARSPQAT
jgi:signal transduction histidine kinase